MGSTILELFNRREMQTENSKKEIFIDFHTHAVVHEEHVLPVYNYMIGHSEEPDSFFTAGIHPWYINEELWSMELSEVHVMSTDPKCIAIGECGLDKLRGPLPEIQEAVFRAQIDMAGQLKKPLVIHCVKKFREVLKCLAEEDFTGDFMLHGLNTNPENIKPFLDMSNAHFSFGQALLQAESNAETMFRTLPLERCFLETDDSSTSIKNVYFRAAEIKGISVQEVSEQMVRNLKKVFMHGSSGKR
jgi:TatD DNase family protein